MKKNFNALLLLSSAAVLIASSCNSTAKKSDSLTDTLSIENIVVDTTTAGYKEYLEDTKEVWSYRDSEDKMSGSMSHYASIPAKNRLHFSFPYDGGTDVELHIRKKGSTDVFVTVSKGQFVGESIRVRFDKDKARRWSVSSASDGSSEIRFIDDAKLFISKLKKHKSMIVEAEFYREGLQLIEFDIDGLKWNY